jgi:hypothetical protein
VTNAAVAVSAPSLSKPRPRAPAQSCRRAGQVEGTGQERVGAAYATISYGYRSSRVLLLLVALLVLVADSLKVPTPQATLRHEPQRRRVPGRTARRKTQQRSDNRPGSPQRLTACWLTRQWRGPLLQPCPSRGRHHPAADSLEQRVTWYTDLHVPDGELMVWWLNLATLLGWLPSSIFAVSLALLSRNL